MARSLSDEMSEQESISFKERMNKKPRHQSQFEKMKHTWDAIDKEPSIKFMDTRKAWKRLESSLEQDGLLENKKTRLKTIMLHPLFRIAASILLILGLALPVVYYSIKNSNPAVLTISHSSDEGISSFDLPDGSRVFLNEGSDISYPREFQDDRTIKLQGEAFFEVMANPAKPFKVHTGKVVVSVLGTHFNIKKLPGEAGIEVFVETGTVQLYDTESKNRLILSEGELGLSDESGIRMGELKNLNYLSWKTKKFVFDNEDISSVFRTLESAYHVKIITENLDVQNMRLTSTYMQQSIDAILETLCTAFGLNVERVDKTYYLKTSQ